jgi:hypothetical protein
MADNKPGRTVITLEAVLPPRPNVEGKYLVPSIIYAPSTPDLKGVRT